MTDTAKNWRGLGGWGRGGHTLIALRFEQKEKTFNKLLVEMHRRNDLVSVELIFLYLYRPQAGNQKLAVNRGHGYL